MALCALVSFVYGTDTVLFVGVSAHKLGTGPNGFGYLLAGATLMLGFLWALWDEDHFTWQDRISQTYVTGAMPLMEQDALEVPSGRRSFARR